MTRIAAGNWNLHFADAMVRLVEYFVMHRQPETELTNVVIVLNYCQTLCMLPIDVLRSKAEYGQILRARYSLAFRTLQSVSVH